MICAHPKCPRRASDGAPKDTDAEPAIDEVCGLCEKRITVCDLHMDLDLRGKARRGKFCCQAKPKTD